MIKSTSHIKVSITLSSEGLTSSHKFSTPKDQKVAHSWPSGGLVQVSWALMAEALRRESYTMLIAMLSSGTPMDEISPHTLDQCVRAQFMDMLDILSLETCEGMVESMGESLDD